MDLYAANDMHSHNGSEPKKGDIKGDRYEDGNPNMTTMTVINVFKSSISKFQVMSYNTCTKSNGLNISYV